MPIPHPKDILRRRARLPKRFSLKRIMPTTLFSRALLILVIPVVLLQLLVANVFYSRHWDSVVRAMSSATSADIAMLVGDYQELGHTYGEQEARAQTSDRAKTLGIRMVFRDDPTLVITSTGEGRRKFPDFYDELHARIAAPLTILHGDEDTINIRVNANPRAVIDFSFARKRLASSTTWIFILWMVGSAILLTTIAILFLRNQVRPIVTLARVAEQFGLGQDVENYTPRGANEVRRAGRAFLIMADRIRRHVASRTEMLAGISHDLRTPLTRMKLELEMRTIDPAIREALSADIEEMRRMIDEYLDFARGDAGELPEPMDIARVLEDVVRQYKRQRAAVTLAPTTPALLMLRPQAIRRMLSNLIDNALRYGGGAAELTLEQSLTFVRIKVADHGPGIPEAQHEAVFKPFTRLEPSRNSATGGVGLGLSIARAIAQSHGGDVGVENQRDDKWRITGLEVTVRLPREVQSLS